MCHAGIGCHAEGGVCHSVVEWVKQGGFVILGWGGLCRVGVGYVMQGGCVIVGWGVSYCVGCVMVGCCGSCKGGEGQAGWGLS